MQAARQILGGQKSVTDIAKLYGISKKTVYEWVRAFRSAATMRAVGDLPATEPDPKPTPSPSPPVKPETPTPEPVPSPTPEKKPEAKKPDEAPVKKKPFWAGK